MYGNSNMGVAGGENHEMFLFQNVLCNESIRDNFLT